MSDLAQILAALRASRSEAREPRDPGRPPALSPAQVESARRRRRLPRGRRPRVDEIAAEFGVGRRTVQRALHGDPPYDWGDPAPRNGSRNRNRGSQRFGPTD